MSSLWKSVPFVFLSLFPLPAAVNSFDLSLPADSAVRVGAPSHLEFRLGNTGEGEGLSRLTLRFPPGYLVTAGSAPSGWTLDLAGGDGAEISFRTEDEATCMGAVAPGDFLVFRVAVIAPPSRAPTPDRLASAEAEQSCRGVALDPPVVLPAWDRLGIEATLAADPAVLGLGGIVTVTMTVTSLSTTAFADITPLLSTSGTGGVGGRSGPLPGSLALAPGASDSVRWTARATSPGTMRFSGQAVSGRVASPPVRSETVLIGDLEVSLSVAPERIVSGQEVQVQMTVTNRGPVRVADVVPSSLVFEGTAVPSAAAAPTPASLSVLEPGQSATFAWATTITGAAGETYAFSGWASAEGGSIVSARARSNGGGLAENKVAKPDKDASMAAVGGGGAPGGPSPASGGAPLGSASLRFVGLTHDGTLTGGATFSGRLLRDLRIIVGWATLSGTHTQRLELFTPDGSLYQRLTTEVVGTSVETRLPVGGTWITEFSLLGAWRVDVYLDSETMPIATGAFVLTP